MRLSDKSGRRKPFIVWASVIMAASFVLPLAWPTVTSMLVYSFVMGLGFGTYIAIDLALMTEVLPASVTGSDELAESAGRDLAILGIATTIPQAITPGLAGALITVFGGYQVTFIAGIVFVLLGIVAIAPSARCADRHAGRHRMPQFRTSDEVTLAYTDEGDGTAVVLVAGILAAATSWHFTTRALVDAGYRVLGFDRRNHGASEAPTHGQRLARHGKDLHELLSSLDLDRAYLVGGSMGASSIWAYFDLFGYARCLGMVSVDQTPKMVNRDGWGNGFYGLTAENAGTFFDAGIPATGRGTGMDKTIAGVTAIVEATGSTPMGSDAGAPATLPLLRDHAGADWRDVIARATCPMLMVAGAQSQFWPSTHATDMAALNANVQAVVLDGCGHPVNLDDPDAFNATVLGFLGG